ncbi:unnamed protein product (mitochondrion) [Plasmodiophora brassicae]|uniref:Cation efflux protein cytoplasmic domain-containing protein n=1 Tax=Plasmodiophora brassicae TaxID=37360 RepID=A0A0G4IIZ7_PLABS|nr:hypothetical protein PBRA_009589 [Plasmodiophora brassicae]SPR00919.1 unnamed protein product [Plasmodiophora brassicae]
MAETADDANEIDETVLTNVAGRHASHGDHDPVDVPVRPLYRKHMYDHEGDHVDDHTDVPWYRDGLTLRFVAMFLLTAIYFFVELIFGTLTGSLALVADAMHMFSDLIALLVGYYAMKAARKPTSYRRTYGQVRMEVIASLMNATFMLSICLTMVLDAINKFLEGQGDQRLAANADLLIIVCVVGLALSIFGMVLFGHGHGHGHSHGPAGADDAHAHDDGHGQSRSLMSRCLPSNLNLRGVVVHVIGDALTNIAVIVSSLIIKYCQGDWRLWADPVSAIVISVIIIVTTVPLVKEASIILLQQTPDHIRPRQLICEMLKVEGVHEVHELHIWALTSSKFVASVHVCIGADADFGVICDRLKFMLHAFDIHSSTIQPERLQPGADIRQGNPHMVSGNPCSEPICSDGQACLDSMCCVRPDQVISKVAKKHRD